MAELVVVFDDDDEILTLYKDVLTDEGYRVEIDTFSGDELARITRLRPDLVIVDLLVGSEAIGWQLIQKIRMSRATIHIPLIMVTADVRWITALAERLAEKNVTVILKPFDLDDLLDAVATALADADGSARGAKGEESAADADDGLARPA